jgi:hypothetical protein
MDRMACVPFACPYEYAAAGTGGHSRAGPSAPGAQPTAAQTSVTASSAFAGSSQMSVVEVLVTHGVARLG